MSARSPGLLTGNPPPRWGAPGDDPAVGRPATASADSTRSPRVEGRPMAANSVEVRARRTSVGNTGYAGDITVQQAWDLLEENPEAVLVDVRTDAEWKYVGVPDTSSIGRQTLLIEWVSFPTGARNDNFVDQLKEAGLTPGETARRVPVPVRPALHRRGEDGDRGGHRPVLQRARGLRGPDRQTRPPWRLRLASATACPGSSRDRPARRRVPQAAARGRRARDPRGARRAHPLRLRGERRGAVPDLRVRLRERGRGRGGVHRRHRSLRVLALRQPDRRRCSRSACA